MADRYNSDKLRWSLIPVDVMEELIAVAEMGAKKYGKDNWQQPPYMTRDDILDSLYRHIAARREGELVDSESNKQHMAHAMWNCMALLAYDLRDYFAKDIPVALPQYVLGFPSEFAHITTEWTG